VSVLLLLLLIHTTPGRTHSRTRTGRDETVAQAMVRAAAYAAHAVYEQRKPGRTVSMLYCVATDSVSADKVLEAAIATAAKGAIVKVCMP
jgi:hypothetical protein